MPPPSARVLLVIGGALAAGRGPGEIGVSFPCLLLLRDRPAAVLLLHDTLGARLLAADRPAGLIRARDAVS